MRWRRLDLLFTAHGTIILREISSLKTVQDRTSVALDEIKDVAACDARGTTKSTTPLLKSVSRGKSLVAPCSYVILRRVLI